MDTLKSELFDNQKFKFVIEMEDWSDLIENAERSNRVRTVNNKKYVDTSVGLPVLWICVKYS